MDQLHTTQPQVYSNNPTILRVFGNLIFGQSSGLQQTLRHKLSTWGTLRLTLRVININASRGAIGEVWEKNYQHQQATSPHVSALLTRNQRSNNVLPRNMQMDRHDMLTGNNMGTNRNRNTRMELLHRHNRPHKPNRHRLWTRRVCRPWRSSKYIRP